MEAFTLIHVLGIIRHLPGKHYKCVYIYASYHQYLEFYQSMTLGHEVLEQITKVLGLNM